MNPGRVDGALEIISTSQRNNAQLYCESCGTMGTHMRRCATCGFSFEAAEEMDQTSRQIAVSER